MKQTIIISIFIVICSLLRATDYVAITEIMYDTPLEEDPNEDCHNEGEFIELYNAHEYEADISGWSIETINPQQIFHIPNGVVIAPQSTLVIAYYDSNNPCELEVFKDYFCWLYNLNMTDDFSFLYQDQLVLPNDTTILVLKDNTGLTRDSADFGIQFEESPQHAPNDDTEIGMGNLENVFSIQRTRIRFEANGTTMYNYVHWAGKNVAVHTQDIPNNSVGSVKKGIFACNIIPSGTESSLQECNFILEVTPRVALSNVDVAQLDPTVATVKRTYYDPMYRPFLSILYGNSPTRQNIATLKEYDAYARPTIEWLPIALEMNHLTKSTYKNNSALFYSTESRPFVKNTYSTDTWDNGIIKNELISTQKAGADMGAHKTNFYSRGNTSNEVKLFKVQHNGDLQCIGYYSDKMLQVKQITDEDGKSKVTYTNSQEQVVMEKVDNATTYYVYNDLNQLCYVLPPLAVGQLDYGTYSDTIDCLRKYAYVYKYDDRGNQIYKRLPGCKPILMVYDKSNSLVLTQTGNQRRQGELWTIHEYDSLRRLIYTSNISR